MSVNVEKWKIGKLLFYRFVVCVAFFIWFCFSACESETPSLRIAAAANLKSLMPTLQRSFERRHPHLRIEVVTGSSGKLYTQIINGLEVDVFMSADMDYPTELYKKRRTLEKPKTYALGKLVLFSAQRRNFSIDELSFHKNVTIAIANPHLAPYGRAALEVMKSKNVPLKKVKLVEGSNVNHCVHFALNGADYGFISLAAIHSDAMKPYLLKPGAWEEIPENMYSPIAQGAVVLNDSLQAAGAKQFYDFIFSKEAKRIFAQFGYDNPMENDHDN